jgi:glycosyltransferase involved in cell wall biosynthesis
MTVVAGRPAKRLAEMGKNVLFFFNHAAAGDLQEIEQGRLPTERLYGLVELRDRGWRVAACDERFVGATARITKRIRRRWGLNFMSWAALMRAARSDVLLVKDEFSMSLTLLARLLGKRIIYLDSLFDLPKHLLRQLVLRANLRLAPEVVCYSQYQAEFWTKVAGVKRSKFRVLPYAIDTSFYRTALARAEPARSHAQPYVLSVGRDTGRDFGTLIAAARCAGLRVKLVTLPYLVPEAARGAADVDVLERISYAELFQLYAEARMVAVPLKDDMTYPAGIRAVMEALAVGRATIATRTHILEEYVPDDERNVLYVSAEDADELCAAIRRLDTDDELRSGLETNGREYVAARYHMDAFVDELEQLLMIDNPVGQPKPSWRKAVAR